ncbi:MAG TPA: hypothetical protein VF221_14045 [Chloroflexota bacterium]
MTSFTPATSSAAGSISFSAGSVTATYPIAAGVTLAGQAAVTTGANVCLSATLSGGSIVSGAVTANVNTAIVICGPVTAYTAATATTPGSLTIAGIVFPTALGSTFTGVALAPGVNVCLSARLSGLGSLVSGLAVTNTSGALTLTGPFTTFIPPTATTTGLVTFGTSSFVIPAGSTITVGGSVPLSATTFGGGFSRALMTPM